MAQHDFQIDNASGLSVRTDMNLGFQALVSCNSGVVEPATPYAGMLWLDLSFPPDGVLRQRNQANTAWLPVLLPPEFRFGSADMSMLARTSPNRFVINDKADGTGTDILTLRDDGLLTLNPSSSGVPAAAGDVVTKGFAEALAVPIGAIMFFANNAVPTNWLKANGASLLRVSYEDLFNKIGTTYGAVDSTHFTLPDLRGEFVRGFDDGRGIDASRVFGSWQADAFASHTHSYSMGTESSDHTHYVSGNTSSDSHNHTTSGPDKSGAYAIGSGGPPAGYSNNVGSNIVRTTSSDSHYHSVNFYAGYRNAAHTHALTINNQGGSDTHPRNVAMLACIKYV